MQRSIFIRYFMPFLQWFGLMIIFALLIDYLLHRLELVQVGRYLGYLGTTLIIVSFVYSLRKRKLIEYGSPKTLLAIHEYMSWTGSILILVHAGIHFNAILPWLAVLMLIIAVASGLVGKFLLKNASETLKEKKKMLKEKGLTPVESDRELYYDSLTVEAMKKWRVVHLPITLILGLLSLIHMVTAIMFWK